MDKLLVVTRWLLAATGAVISIGGAAAFAGSQSGSLWPLPGLVLLNWSIVAVIGFLGVLSEAKASLYARGRGTWFAVGALIPLMVLGAFSIGPYVLLSLVAFLAAAILTAIQLKSERPAFYKPLVIGIVANLGVLLVSIMLGRPAI